jgi:AraC-like DNA-binding protein
LRVLERFFALRLAACSGEARRQECLVSHVIERICRADGPIAVQQLAAESGVTRRHLVRLFREQVGLAPKTLARVLRFHKVIESVEARGPNAVCWSELAYGCGYYDQAHFVQEFRSFSGINPSSYPSHRGDYIDWIVE